MKPKGKKTLKNKQVVHRKTPKKGGMTVKVQKITVGVDEFCPNCMEWRPYDELTGRCSVCGRIIKKIGEARKITDEYDLKDFSNEHDEPQETGEF